VQIAIHSEKQRGWVKLPGRPDIQILQAIEHLPRSARYKFGQTVAFSCPA
jgi:hypothetical protein